METTRQNAQRKELSDFVSSEHFNQDKQIYENRRPELIEAMSKRIDMGTMIDFLNDTPHRVEEPLPKNETGGYTEVPEAHRFRPFCLARTFIDLDERSKPDPAI